MIKRGMDLSKKSMLRTLSNLSDPRDRVEMFQAFYQDAKHLPPKQRKKVYSDMAEISEEYGNYAMAGNLYRIAGKEKKASEMFRESAWSGQQTEKERRIERKRHDLARKLSSAVAVVIMFVGALFLAPSITGRVIDGMQRQTANTIGIVLFVLGLIVYYFISKNR